MQEESMLVGEKGHFDGHRELERWHLCCGAWGFFWAVSKSWTLNTLDRLSRLCSSASMVGVLGPVTHSHTILPPAPVVGVDQSCSRLFHLWSRRACYSLPVPEIPECPFYLQPGEGT